MSKSGFLKKSLGKLNRSLFKFWLCRLSDENGIILDFEENENFLSVGRSGEYFGRFLRNLDQNLDLEIELCLSHSRLDPIFGGLNFWDPFLWESEANFLYRFWRSNDIILGPVFMGVRGQFFWDTRFYGGFEHFSFWNPDFWKVRFWSIFAKFRAKTRFGNFEVPRG